MATARSKKDRSLKETLTKPAGNRADNGTTLPVTPSHVGRTIRPVPEQLQQQRGFPAVGHNHNGNAWAWQLLIVTHDEDEERSVTRTFLEQLFASLKTDLQIVKKEISLDLKEVRRAVGARVVALEEHEAGREKEVEQLQQEVLWLREQQIDLQAHEEDLENRSRHNNIRIRGAPIGAEEEDVALYVLSLFNQILGVYTAAPIQFERVHRVGPPHLANAPSADILVCVHDFPLKERILPMAKDQHPPKFRGYLIITYQDLSAITLQKRRDIRPITSHLRDKGISYSWGHPF
ncbi:hypothetical protein NDU88_005062 [Pleurodeles waltl]|uniref:Uncharacterized protein n=1 Tax=Pleurodeles waltl TaxID=8319 RepID=A0AAV7LSS6_PLEWA|nr:hypothetical protein NDU88_005062 [Pleurodeles waltl]